MSEMMTKNSTRIEKLSSVLLSTLDEQIFFSEISKCLHDVIDADKVKVFRVRENGSSIFIAENGKVRKRVQTVEKGAGIIGYVLRTKKAYFSNNVSRDPLFASEDNGNIIAELCVPIGCDGFMIGTLHIQSSKEERSFTREDIAAVLDVLAAIEKPIRNMKIYLFWLR